jgi:Tfp pilus assembly pilus retraction ATPase PilT
MERRRTKIITDLSVNVHAASVALLSESVCGSLHLADAIETVERVVDVYVHGFVILFVVVVRVRSVIHDEVHGRLRTRRLGSLLLMLSTLSRS